MPTKDYGSIPMWVRKMVADIAMFDPTIVELAETYQKSRNTIYRKLYQPEVQELLKEEREKLMKQIEEKMNTAVHLSMETYLEILKKLPIDENNRYNAARDILKGTGRLNDTIQHSGGITVTIAPELARDNDED